MLHRVPQQLPFTAFFIILTLDAVLSKLLEASLNISRNAEGADVSRETYAPL
jgi:hypothetical protein